MKTYMVFKVNIIPLSSDPLRTTFGPCSDHVRLASVICRNRGGSFSISMTEEIPKQYRTWYEESIQSLLLGFEKIVDVLMTL